jgi:hypothetical protein
MQFIVFIVRYMSLARIHDEGGENDTVHMTTMREA